MSTSKKPAAPKKSAAPKPAPAPKEERGEKMPIARRTEVLVKQIEKRIAKMQKRFNAWPTGVQQCTIEVLQALSGLRKELDTIPDTFKPERVGAVGKGKLQIEAGATVDIAERARKHYEDLLDADEMTNLKVTKIKGSKIAVLTEESATRLFIPRGHLVVTKAAEV